MNQKPIKQTGRKALEFLKSEGSLFPVMEARS